MSIQQTEAAELLSLNRFNVDEEEPHIVLDKKICRTKCKDKPCLMVCPAVLYKLDKTGEMTFDYAGCLECGTCRVVCRAKGITKWEYPRGTFGISYRHG